MKRFLFFLFVFVQYSAVAQIQVDFSCHGSGYDACDVTLTDMSVSPNSPIVAWYWNLGNGETSDAKDACATYPMQGSFGVCLTVTNFVGDSATLCKYNFITGGTCNFNPGVNELLGSDFSIYKEGNLLILRTDLIDQLEFVLYDQLSRVKFSKSFRKQLSINLDDTQSGVFFYSITSSSGEKYSRKIFIN